MGVQPLSQQLARTARKRPIPTKHSGDSDDEGDDKENRSPEADSASASGCDSDSQPAKMLSIRGANIPRAALSVRSRAASLQKLGSLQKSTVPLAPRLRPAVYQSKAFKCPLPNYQPRSDCRTATLGQRKVFTGGIQGVLGKLQTFISVPQIAAPSDAEAAAAPLCIFDPSLETDEAKKLMHTVFVDPFISAKLRPHQREGVTFMFQCLAGLRKDGFCGCILADGMGLGKTFQSISVLWTLLTTGVARKPSCTKPLILCPSSLVSNWGKELQRWLGDRVQPLAVDDTRASCVKDVLTDFGGVVAMRCRRPQVLIMSYNTFRIHKEAVYRKGVDMVICDEAHQLKNGDSQITQAVAGLPATKRLLLSGTPVQNDLSEFFTLFNVAVPGLLGTIASFRRQYENPVLRGQDSEATDTEVAIGMERSAQLLELCGQFMLRRACAVLKEYLPPKVEQVVFCKMSSLQLQLFQHFLKSPAVVRALSGKQKQSVVGATGGGGRSADDLSVLAAITALKKLSCHPDLLPFFNGLPYWRLETYTAEHAAQIYDMHKPAKPAWVQQRAPSARISGSGARSGGAARSGGDSDACNMQPDTGSGKGSNPVITGFEGCLPLFSSTTVSPSHVRGAAQPFHSGKMMVLECLLKAIRQSEPTDKVVLVSNYTEALDVLGQMCRNNGWATLRLDGTCAVKARQPLVDRFNSPADPSFVFLLSSKAGGVGLNIIGANRLVLFDPDWNPANDLQAMARVWREGQKKRVWIYRMLTAGSIEEKVYQRQLSKMGLSNKIVDDQVQTRQFSADELRALFKVDPSARCDTHAAIRCKCDGSAAAMARKRQEVLDELSKHRAAAAAAASAAAAAASTSSASEQTTTAPAAPGAPQAPTEDGVMSWAHLASAGDGVDPTWKAMSPWLRDKFITYLFSDHVTNEPPPPQADELLDMPEAADEELCDDNDAYSAEDDAAHDEHSGKRRGDACGQHDY